MDISARARALLSDEFFTGVVEKQRLLYVNNILNSGDDEVQLRENQRLKLKGLEELLASLQSIAKDDEVKEKRFRFF